VVIWGSGASEELGDVGAGGGEGVADIAEDAGEVVVAVMIGLVVTAHGEAGGLVLVGLVAIVG
jgi:hypothetical protein